MKHKLLVIAVGLSVLMAGCGSLTESGKIEYKSAGKLPPLEVPPDLTQPGKDDRYSVPDSGRTGSATFSAYSDERATQSPRGAGGQEVLPQVDKMRVERAGAERWLVVPADPDTLWPEIKSFWQDNGFIINIERPESGVMETDWAEDRAKIPLGILRDTIGKALDSLYSTPERDKFRTRLEPGVVPGTTEIYISHRGMYEIYTQEGTSETRWQPRPADPGLETEMLRRLMVRLGVEETKAKAMVAAAVAEDRAKILPDGTLQVADTFDRGWRRVGLALDRLGFTVEDRDRSQGVYYVRYVDPEIDLSKAGKEDGFLSKLAFWRDNKDDPALKQKYRIHVKANGDASLVQILTAEGGADTSETGKKIVRLLHDQLK